MGDGNIRGTGVDWHFSDFLGLDITCDIADLLVQTVVLASVAKFHNLFVIVLTLRNYQSCLLSHYKQIFVLATELSFLQQNILMIGQSHEALVFIYRNK
jgi:hypothetical protein